jgi:hypothetical protein
MKPDVIVIAKQQTMLFQPQTRPASEWLHRRCGLVADQIRGTPNFAFILGNATASSPS